jgi:hypothetical protein
MMMMKRNCDKIEGLGRAVVKEKMNNPISVQFPVLPLPVVWQ